MRCNTSIGEAVAEYGESEYLVRPSFSALAGIGSPEDIDSIIRGCLAAFNNIQNGHTPTVNQLSACAVMLSACSDLPVTWLGWWRESTRIKGKTIWVQGIVTINDLVVMANHCVRWGVMGDPRKKPSKKAKEQSKGYFDPAEFVAIACMPSDSGGLGWSRNDAWQATMVEFQRACEERYKMAKGNRKEPLSQDEVKELFKKTKERHAKARKVRVNHKPSGKAEMRARGRS